MQKVCDAIDRIEKYKLDAKSAYDFARGVLVALPVKKGKEKSLKQNEY